MTTITYTVPQESIVILKVYNTRGIEITTLVDDKKQAGTYIVNFDAGDLPAGVYYYRLQAGNFSQSRKMVLSNGPGSR
jgi:hypothetical protein